jgi:hypothetical protein
MVRAGKDHMDGSKILATAGALVLTVTGGVSALFLTVGATNSPATPAATTEIVEYVDSAGNPLPAADIGVATAPANDANAIGGDGPPGASASAYEEDEEHEDHEEHDEDEEHEDEHEEDDDD